VNIIDIENMNAWYNLSLGRGGWQCEEHEEDYIFISKLKREII
jgi:hypothetical protein